MTDDFGSLLEYGSYDVQLVFETRLDLGLLTLVGWHWKFVPLERLTIAWDGRPLFVRIFSSEAFLENSFFV